MKVSELWLREWVDSSLTGAQLAEQLTMAGLEVGGRHPVAGTFKNVVVAQVMRTKPHPQADKLTLCEVDKGAGVVLNIVCGASNVRPGLMVALALPGADLPGGLKIKESVIRGEPSQGMLCSVAELGLDDHADGIMELANDAPMGMDLREYLHLDDHVLDIDVTPNRADCLSVLGIAREVAALNNKPLHRPEVVPHPPATNDVLTIHVQAPEACPQYCARVIHDMNPHAQTPLWLKERLRRSGVRSQHPIVDVTNYVMLELGQPMHAFDLQAIQGAVHVRYARIGEELELLNGKNMILDKDVLLIADDEQPLAIAGIMGGSASGVQAQTTAIFLESAFFNPMMIAGPARRYGLCSDSSQRFERGVDPTLQAEALERATELLLSIVGGRVGPISQVSEPELLPEKRSLFFHPEAVKKLTGLDVPQENMLLILKNLGMTVLAQKEQWVVGIPAHRFDVSQEVDLVEEVIRLYGYDHLQAAPSMTTQQAGKINPYDRLIHRISVFLSNRGYSETISYSFVDPALQQELYPGTPTLSLKNPMSSELSDMRVGMWPGLIASMVHNVHRQQTAMKCFEAGVIFNVHEGELQEQPSMGGLITGDYGHLNWAETARTFDFFDMKGDLQALFTMLHRDDLRFVSATHPALHPGQTARLLIGEQEIGWLGVLHPRLMDALDLHHDVMLFEIALSPLILEPPMKYHPISKYPQIRRDLSLFVPKEICAAQIQNVIRDVVTNNWLKGCDVFDVYTGEGIPEGKKSLAIALILQDDYRTLIDTEINTIISAILKKLDDEWGITLRTGTTDAC
jgi:phenylalanyl-tRNA synthetase beta chain